MIPLESYKQTICIFSSYNGLFPIRFIERLRWEIKKVILSDLRKNSCSERRPAPLRFLDESPAPGGAGLQSLIHLPVFCHLVYLSPLLLPHHPMQCHQRDLLVTNASPGFEFLLFSFLVPSRYWSKLRKVFRVILRVVFRWKERFYEEGISHHDRHRLLKELPESVLTMGTLRFSRCLNFFVESIIKECFFLPTLERTMHWERTGW